MIQRRRQRSPQPAAGTRYKPIRSAVHTQAAKVDQPETASAIVDMVLANIMGFQPEEISTFAWAWKAGMTPASLHEIEIRGEKLADVRQNFLRPTIYPWNAIREYGPPC